MKVHHAFPKDAWSCDVMANTTFWPDLLRVCVYVQKLALTQTDVEAGFIAGRIGDSVCQLCCAIHSILQGENHQSDLEHQPLF